ncbi:MAG: fructose PTS transporter subunit IIA [Bacillus sp. (in: firmicutes)]
MKVETQGGVGAENVLTAKEIQEADGIIIAADRQVDKSRFKGKRLLVVGVKDGIRRPEELFKQFEEGKVPVYKASEEDASGGEGATQKSGAIGAIYKHLMNGVSFMVPFIVVGGLLVAIALALGGENTPGGIVIPEDSIWHTINSIGGAAFGFMVPILAGYIAFSIADKPGLVPGMVGGYIAANGSFYGSEAGAGFLGGIIAGFLAGYVVLAIKKIKVPKAIMPIIIIPVFGSLIVGLAFILFIGGPIVALLGAVDNVLMFFVAVLAGSIVTAVMVNALKKDVETAIPATSVQANNVIAMTEPQEQEAVQVIYKLTDITSFELIETDLTGKTQDEIIDEMIKKLDKAGALHSKEEFKKAIINREKEGSTGIGMNIAIPHGKSAAVKKPSVVFGIKKEGVDWKSLDGTTAKLIFMIAVPESSAGNEHLKILQMLSRQLMDETYRGKLLSASTKHEAYTLLEEIA